MIVSIKVAPAPNILQHPKIKQAAAWEVYGEGVFKGKSVITKEEMQSLLIKELCLSKEDVLVVNMREGNKKKYLLKRKTKTVFLFLVNERLLDTQPGAYSNERKRKDI